MLDFTQEEKDFFMSEALKEAEKSLVKAEIPIGCVIVKAVSYTHLDVYKRQCVG